MGHQRQKFTSIVEKSWYECTYLHLPAMLLHSWLGSIVGGAAADAMVELVAYPGSVPSHEASRLLTGVLYVNSILYKLCGRGTVSALGSDRPVTIPIAMNE